MAQRSASTRFDLPQPFGPTMPGQARLDQQLGGIDEGLETDETKFVEADQIPTPRSGAVTSSWTLLRQQLAYDARQALHFRVAADQIVERQGAGEFRSVDR